MDYSWIIISALTIVIITALIICEKIITDSVLATSQKIAALWALNRQTRFHQISDRFNVIKRYDNKSNYNKIEPAYLMTSEVRANMDYFSEYISKIKENQSADEQYQIAKHNIWEEEFQVDYAALNIPEKIYKWHEERLFRKHELSLVINCEFKVTMSYTSPKGQVHLTKSDTFDFQDLFVCFESVSRAHLDKKTHSRLTAVERGEVSDSLRYDILQRDNFTCVICGASSRQGARLHVDHIIPVSKGGKSTPTNLRTLCERCNIGKSNKIETASAQPVNPVSDNTLVCEKCGSTLILRKGKYGEFYGCSNYPKCKFTKTL